MSICNTFQVHQIIPLSFNMKEFKTILTKLKEIIKLQLQTDKKVLDKDVAKTLGIKPTTLASYKRKNKLPYKAILTYCHENRLDVRKILYSEDQPIISCPAPIEDGKVRVKYFRTLEAYTRYLNSEV